jgi:plastocyanin
VRTVNVSGSPEQPFAFSPRELTVPVGTTVRWTNEDGAFHTVTSTGSLERRRSNGLFSGTLASRGRTFAFSFARPGTYYYYCQPHSHFMTGTVRVTE